MTPSDAPPPARDDPGPVSRRLSIIIPVFNESASFAAILARVRAVELPGIRRELIIVDDGSTDGTAELVDAEQSATTRVIHHDVNRGKGAAIRTGLAAVRGDLVLIQDADLEYDPADYPVLLEPLLAGRTQVVYGSRFLGERRGMTRLGAAANRLLSAMTSLLYGARITDMETCYKLFEHRVIDGMRLRSCGFDIEPELTAKLMKRGVSILEVPIRYAGRSQAEGKKIGWRDGVRAMWTLVRYRFMD